MESINELKFQILRNSIGTLSRCVSELCDIRPDLYTINRAEWENELEKIRKQLGAKQILLFIGPFSSGKSSFINALLGEDILPANNRPCTSVVTELRFVDGGGHRGVAVRKDGQESSTEYDFGDLLKMVDGPTGAIGESAAYHHIELNYDISQSESQCLRQLCDAGVTIVDAPGYGSPYYSNDEIIEEYISKASHTFWINPVDRMGGASDYKKLSDIRKKTTILIPIMSKADLIDSESKMESIRDDYTETIGSLFRSKEPIFCSAIKYRKAMEIDYRIRMERLSGIELSKAMEEMDALFRESGLSNVFSAIIDSSTKKTVESSKIVSVCHDLFAFSDDIKKSADRELAHWRRELKAKGWDDSCNYVLEEARDSISLWIEGESNRVGQLLDEEIALCVKNYLAKCLKKIDVQELQDIVGRIWNEKIGGCVELWAKRLAETYKEKVQLDVVCQSKEFKLDWLTPVGMATHMRDVCAVVFDTFRSAGSGTIVQGGLGAVLLASAKSAATFSIPLTAKTFTITSIATTISVMGAALMAIAAVGIIPIYCKYAKKKKNEQHDAIEEKVSNWLNSLQMGKIVHSFLTCQNEELFKRLEKEHQKVAEELIDNKDRCESILSRISEMEEDLKIQFVSIKNGGQK